MKNMISTQAQDGTTSLRERIANEEAAGVFIPTEPVHKFGDNPEDEAVAIEMGWE
jgi:hypothetical protein